MAATPIYAGLAALIFAFLSLRVIQLRGSAKVSLGFAENRSLERAVRVHANFAEYVPLVLLLMALAELQSLPLWQVNALGVILLAGRLVHALGVLREPEPIGFRIVGMVLTLTALIWGGAANLFGAL